MGLKEMSDERLGQAKKGYSGQKKCRTVKNTVISNQSGGNVLFVGKSHPGWTHHKKMANEDILVFPDDSLLWPDTGYQGYLPAAVIMIYQPEKRLKNREGRVEDKFLIDKFLTSRLQVEHAMEVSNLAT
ncbi:MAG: transposase family protein [Candidatus Poribacteria bacterium]|jgi:hypothetical protein|nr:transposase family protein [Candidatus Poribacteria bacterium]